MQLELLSWAVKYRRPDHLGMGKYSFSYWLRLKVGAQGQEGWAASQSVVFTLSQAHPEIADNTAARVAFEIEERLEGKPVEIALQDFPRIVREVAKEEEPTDE